MLLLKAYLILGLVYTLMYVLLRFELFEQNSRAIASITQCPVVIVDIVHAGIMTLVWGLGVLLVIVDIIHK